MFCKWTIILEPITKPHFLHIFKKEIYMHEIESASNCLDLMYFFHFKTSIEQQISVTQLKRTLNKSVVKIRLKKVDFNKIFFQDVKLEKLGFMYTNQWKVR